MNLFDEIRKLTQEYKKREQEAKELHDRIHALEAQSHRVNHSIPLPRTGIDYAFAPYPSVNKLHSAGISFACRYLTGSGKALGEQEAKELSGAGIDLVAIYEVTGREPEEGYNAGIRDAKRAIEALNRLKPKGEPPVYFTCDFDAAGEHHTDTVLEYIRGAVHTIGWSRVGLYAGYDVIKRAHEENRCKFLWQTYAWSRGLWYHDAQLRQVQNDLHLLGASVDLDKAVAADFGQFRV